MKCINCGAELGTLAIATKCPYCGTMNSPFSDNDTLGEEKELVYEKNTISEEEFRDRLRKFLSESPKLPLDFLDKVEIVSFGIESAFVAVFRNNYTVKYRKIQGDEKNRRYADETDTFPLIQAVPTSYLEIPQEIVDDMCKPSEKEWFDPSLKRSSFMSERQADLLKKEVLTTMKEFSANDVEKVLEKSVRERCKFPWRYEVGSIKLVGSSISATPTLCLVNFNRFKWRYMGTMGSCYYNPASERICSENLPVDKEIARKVGRAASWDSFISGFCYVVFGLIVLSAILGWLFSPLKWYQALGRILLGGIVFLPLGGIADSFFYNKITRKNTAARLQSGANKI